MFKGLMLAAAGAATIAALFVVSTASAQYPEPKGSLVCTTTVSAKFAGSEVHATLRDSNGNPVKGVAVSFKVIGGSGTIDTSTAYTDASGDAWVKAEGSISVLATYDGVQCSAVTEVLGQTFHPPSTGDAGLVSDGTGGSATDDIALAAALAVMGVSGVALVALRRRRLAREV